MLRIDGVHSTVTCSYTGHAGRTICMHIVSDLTECRRRYDESSCLRRVYVSDVVGYDVHSSNQPMAMHQSPPVLHAEQAASSLDLPEPFSVPFRCKANLRSKVTAVLTSKEEREGCY